MHPALSNHAARLARFVKILHGVAIAMLGLGVGLVVLGLQNFGGADGGLLGLLAILLGAVLAMAGWRFTWMLVRLRRSASLLSMKLGQRAFDYRASRARRVN